MKKITTDLLQANEKSQRLLCGTHLGSESRRTKIYTTNTRSSESSPVNRQLFSCLILGECDWLPGHSVKGNFIIKY